MTYKYTVSLCLFVLFLFGGAGCGREHYDLTVSLFALQETKGPLITSVQLAELDDAGEVAGQTEAEIGESLPFAVVVGVPLRFETQPLLLEIVGFAGEIEVFRERLSLAPNQREAALVLSPCSDLVVVGNEECDDGNLINGDGCDQNCTPTGCENGVSLDGELCFDKNDDLVGPGTPEQARGGDFDQDGTPDLVARYAITDPGTQGFSVRLFLNEASGRFGSFVDLPLLGEPKHIATGDLNGDGAPEVVVLQESGGISGAVIFANNGDGSFSRQNGPVLENGTTTAFELADLSGDGVLDLVSANEERRSVSVRNGNGNGSFDFIVSASFVLPVDVTPRVVVPAQIDGEPGLDLVLLNDTAGVLAEPFRVVFLLNDGAGVLRDVPGPTLRIAPSALFAAQLDNKAGLDLAFAVQSSRVEENGILTFTNEGAGVFSEVGTFAVQGNLTSITAADFDGDGDQDLAATDFGGAKVKVLVNNGAGQLDAPREVETGELETRLSPVSLFSDEFNGDGVADLIVTGKNLGLLFSNP